MLFYYYFMYSKIFGLLGRIKVISLKYNYKFNYLLAGFAELNIFFFIL